MRVGAVIVLYNPSLKEANELINTVSKMVDTLSIVDNSLVASKVTLPPENTHYHHFKSNKGVAAAQNVGLSDLLADECAYALLLDQDSEVPSSMVPQLVNKLRAYPDSLVAVGPRIVCSFTNDEQHPKVQKALLTENELSFVPQIISSGMMISLAKLSAVGLKEESLFIDGVDHEWCWRARLNSYQIAIANDVKMRHTMGEHRSNFLGVTYKVGKPIRLYYQFRNIFILSRREYVPRYWKLRNLGILPLRVLVNLLNEKDKILRAKYMWQGICDGIMKRAGAYKVWH
ncbi:glycosyltransferase family 2 protein [Glaciecola sp. KUL10]|uniref:glycosyltransferase family 2 protein n=1 Tax=Glaciecola sp. (strain KUL10) TaxID=2161813 RepID=UPI000D78548A|nr:glycosyltransferase family 2 protein [Glaciecola sp. KUL10]GBL04155.1 rhamnosyltransferase [Glaciecola sp. KUL10]